MTTAELDIFAAIAEAEAERDAAYLHMDATDTRDENAIILDAIRLQSNGDRPFSANDIRSTLPESVNRNRIGRQFARAAQLGVITFHGYVKSTDKGTHGKRIALWTGIP